MTTKNVDTRFVIFILVLSLVVFIVSLFLVSGLENFTGRPGVFDLHDLKNFNISMLFGSSLVLFVMSNWTLLKLRLNKKIRDNENRSDLMMNSYNRAVGLLKSISVSYIFLFAIVNTILIFFVK